MSNEIDAFTVVRDALQQYGGIQQSAGEWHMVCCPFHDDSSPSCGVFLQMGRPRPFGSYHCLGCGAVGNWNEFAEKTGLPTIQEWNAKISQVSQYAQMLETVDDLVTLTKKSVLKKMACEEAQPWPYRLPWRTFDGEFLRSVGASIIEDRFNDDVAALFFVHIRGTLRGAVKAVYEKSTSRKRTSSYYTMRGNWVYSYGLWPFDIAAKMTRKYNKKFVVLVEGPRDALRLIKRGIPAIAVLGVETISATKITLLRSLGVDTYYVMPDNDKGGTKMWTTLKERMKGEKLRRLRLPKPRDEQGKLIKMDPAAMPNSIMKTVVNLLEERHEVEVVRFDPDHFGIRSVD